MNAARRISVAQKMNVFQRVSARDKGVLRAHAQMRRPATVEVPGVGPDAGLGSAASSPGRKSRFVSGPLYRREQVSEP